MMRARPPLLLLPLVLALLPKCGALAGNPAPRSQPIDPVPVIFDTDIGNDIDDALALAMIHALQSRGHCRLLAVTSTKDHPLSAPFIDVINTFYGRPDIPIGVVKHGATPAEGKFLGLASERSGDAFRYPHDLVSGRDAPSATSLLRKTLASQSDHSVVIIQVGFSTNLARLLASPPDDFSSLSGKELVAKKVRLLSVMAGSFQPVPGRVRHLEYNVVQDLPAARKVFSDWPTPIIFSGYEIGVTLRFPHESIARDFRYVPDHPIPEAYRRYCGADHDRPTWDLTSVLAGILPDRDYFSLSSPGIVHVAEDGYVFFEENAAANRRYLFLNDAQRARVLEALVQLSSEPPHGAVKPSKLSP